MNITSSKLPIKTLLNYNQTIDGVRYYLFGGGDLEKWIGKRFVPLAGLQYYYCNYTGGAKHDHLILPFDTLTRKLVIHPKDIRLTFIRVLYLRDFTNRKCMKLNQEYENDLIYLKEIAKL